MIGVLKGMATTMKHALDGETFTVQYPEEAPEVSPRFRGVHKFSQERCIWCRQCENVCPNDTIQIVMDDKRNGEQYNLHIGSVFTVACVRRSVPSMLSCSHKTSSSSATRKTNSPTAKNS